MLKKIAVLFLACTFFLNTVSFASYEKTQKEPNYNYITVYEGKVLVSDKIIDLEEDSFGHVIGVDDQGFVHVIDMKAYPRYFIGTNEIILQEHRWYLKLDDNTLIPIPQDKQHNILKEMENA